MIQVASTRRHSLDDPLGGIGINHLILTEVINLAIVSSFNHSPKVVTPTKDFLLRRSLPLGLQNRATRRSLPYRLAEPQTPPFAAGQTCRTAPPAVRSRIGLQNHATCRSLRTGLQNRATCRSLPHRPAEPRHLPFAAAEACRTAPPSFAAPGHANHLRLSAPLADGCHRAVRCV